MFGSEYFLHPEILLSSFGEMQSNYKKIAKKKKNSFFVILQKIYIRVFGIPEIGFQVRSLYFQNIIESKLKNKMILNILDAGSGVGIYSFYLAKKYPAAQVVGGEIAKDKLDFSTKFAIELGIPNVHFKYMDVTKTNKDEKKYDLIVNIDVLEHIKDFRKVLNNFNKLLKKDGYIYIHTPQPTQMRIFKSMSKWSHDDHVHEGYTPEELKSELIKLGFKIIVQRETFGFFGKLSWELNHMLLKKGFVISGITYPFLFLISLFDIESHNDNGLGTAILAQKK